MFDLCLSLASESAKVWERSNKYNFNQLGAVSLILIKCSSLCNRIGVQQDENRDKSFVTCKYT